MRVFKAQILLKCVVILSEAAEFSFVWLSDVHLDITFDSDSEQHDFCRKSDFSPGRFLHQWREATGDADFVDERFVLNVKGEAIQPSQGSFVEKPLLSAYYGRYGCDSPASLVWAAGKSIQENLDKAKDGFVLITGDFSAHYTAENVKMLRFLSMKSATRLLIKTLANEYNATHNEEHLSSSQTFMKSIGFFKDYRQQLLQDNSGPQMIACVGNNDLEDDYMPSENSEWNIKHYDLWKDVIVPNDQRDNFIRGQYYSVDVKKRPGLKVICLNTNWYSRQMRQAPINNSTANQRLVVANYSSEEYFNLPKDPVGQMQWLENELKSARELRQKVMIAGHIPPAQSLFRNALMGFSVDQQWHTIYLQRFDELTDEYDDIIVGKYFGHLHTDEFRVQDRSNLSSKQRRNNNGRHKSNYDLILMAPSISPIHGNNPSWRRVNFDLIEDDTTSSRIESIHTMNYVQHYVPLYGSTDGESKIGSFNGKKKLEFDHSYLSDHVLGAGRITAKRVFGSVMSRLTDTDRHAKKLWNNEFIESGTPPVFVMRCVFENWQKPQSVKECVQKFVDGTDKETFSADPVLLMASI